MTDHQTSSAAEWPPLPLVADVDDDHFELARLTEPWDIQEQHDTTGWAR